MGKARKIEGLPSAIRHEDGSSRSLRELSSQELQEMGRKLEQSLQFQIELLRKQYPEECDHLL